MVFVFVLEAFRAKIIPEAKIPVSVISAMG